MKTKWLNLLKKGTSPILPRVINICSVLRDTFNFLLLRLINLFKRASFNNQPQGYYPCRPYGGVLLRFEKWTLRGNHFLKRFAKICEKSDWNSKIFSIIFYFFPKFSKTVLTRDWLFYFDVFATYLRLVEVKKMISAEAAGEAIFQK